MCSMVNEDEGDQLERNERREIVSDRVKALEAVVAVVEQFHEAIPDFTQQLPDGYTNVFMCKCGTQWCKELEALYKLKEVT